ncbi:YlcI/YnfO family protein [Bradyrhizobium liaoningense]|uniref:YlcI/YnfO family protein n=1 Tax=Bradyrhizobium liaoningense TaxID=43992 RepID=UPI00390888F8
MGRTKRWSEDMQARFPEGTFTRIEAVLDEGEDRTDFVREAVERELRRRKAPDVVTQKTTGVSRPRRL